ncbi:hypothetical protein CI102_2777 [Trichoderma harzianum]|nr:hypothetical protein CI102_2777 [Trichoderma harzianum]
MSCKTNSTIRQRPCANRIEQILIATLAVRVVALLGLCCALLRRAVVPGTRQLKSRYIPAANVAADSCLQELVQVLAVAKVEWLITGPVMPGLGLRMALAKSSIFCH